ncbi:MAG: lysostaphin resistance A-like protein [Acidimicrobiales bacterium]
MKSRRGRAKPAVTTAPGLDEAVADRAPVGNSFGLPEAMFGIVAGFVLAFLAVSVYAALAQHPRHPSQYGEDVVSLIALWIGFVGAVVVATRNAARGRSGASAGSADRAGRADPAGGVDSAGSADRAGRADRKGTGSVVRDFGLTLRPWPDIPLGIVAGVASQYLLVPVVEAPLIPFVHHLYSRLGHPAQSLTGDAFGTGLVVLAVLVCVGSPVVEELFFRGLLLRSLLGSFEQIGPRLGPALSIVVTALVFALVHFEALQFLGLAGFGVVLGLLAWRTGRLGPSIVAHMAFNTVTIIAIVVSR